MSNPILDDMMNEDLHLTAVEPQNIVEAEKESSSKIPSALATLSEEELTQAKRLVEQLDEKNTQSVIEYGSTAQKKIGDFSQGVLDKVQAQDLGEVGSSLTDLMYRLKESDTNDLVSGEQGFFDRMFGKVKKSIFEITQKYQKIGAGIDKIALKLDYEQAALLEDNKTLENLYNENLDYFKALNVYIAGAELKLQELEQTIIPKAKARVEDSQGSDNALLIQEVSDLEAYKNRLDKRAYDLKLVRQITIQQAPQIRMIQNTNQELAEKIQTSINTAIPLWKNQVAIALTLLKQKDALASQRIVSETTNDLMTKNSEMLKSSAIEAAKENERGVVDIETLKQTQSDLIETIQETLRIQSEGSQKRRESEVELARMEDDIKNKLLELSGK